MFDRRDNDGRGELLPGLRQKTRVSGEKVLLTEFALGRGGVLPPRASLREDRRRETRRARRRCVAHSGERRAWWSELFSYSVKVRLNPFHEVFVAARVLAH